jgi:O-antigen ligase
MLEYIIVFGAALAFSMACSITRKGFSLNIFLCGISIAFIVLVWKGSLPLYFIVLAVIIIIAMFFFEPEKEPVGEST